MGKLTELKNHPLVGGTRLVDVRGFWLRNEIEAMQRLPKYGKPLSLVGCSLSGADAFFVRNDLLDNKFEPPCTAEKHCEPARPHFAKIKAGHPTSFQTFEKRLKDSPLGHHVTQIKHRHRKGMQT